MNRARVYLCINLSESLVNYHEREEWKLYIKLVLVANFGSVDLSK